MKTHFARTLGVAAAAGILISWVVPIHAGQRQPYQAVSSGPPGYVRVASSDATPQQEPVSIEQCGCQQCAGSGTGCILCPPVKWLLHCDYFSASPDHGWNRPVKRPIRRAGVVYQRYWPDQWYGQRSQAPGQATRWHPIIATPTDTTQLGYQYQHVPTWQPNPSMLPPQPWPGNWHYRACPGRTYGPIIWETDSRPAAAPEPALTPAVPPAPAKTAMNRVWKWSAKQYDSMPSKVKKLVYY